VSDAVGFPEEPPVAPTGMTEQDLVALVEQEIRSAEDVSQGPLAAERTKALNYYYARPFGNEVDGRSAIVLADVAETVDWVMPSLVRMFTGGRQVARYEPIGPEDEEGAKQRTDYINKVFMREQNGAMLLHDAFKTALVEKHGLFHVFVEELAEPSWETYQDLSDVALASLLAKPDVEPTNYSEHTEMIPTPDPQTGEMVPVPMRLHDVTIKISKQERRLRVETFPPNEFLISKRWAHLDEGLPFCGRKRKMTVSTLVASGFDRTLCEQIPADDQADSDQEREERFRDEDSGVASIMDREGPSREVWVTDCSILVDYDGDGFAERRRVLVGGTGNGLVLLANERQTEVPFASITPYPIPHKFWGRSLADIVLDLQLIRSTLTRMMLDHLYLTVNPRWEAVEGEVELDDLLTSRSGGIVRTTAPGMVKALDRPELGPTPFSMLEYLHGERENRSGSTRYNQGLDASSLNQTAHGISKIMDASQARVELIARIFAESGLKRLFWLLARLMKRGGFQRQVVKLRNQWVEIDPATWEESSDVVIEVGIGVGQAQERIANLMQILEKQQIAGQALGPLLVTPQKVYATLSALSEAMGFPMDEQFFRDPGDAEIPPPPPEPERIVAEAKAEETKGRLQLEMARLELDTMRSKAEAALKDQEIQVRVMLEREKIASEERIALANVTAKVKTAKAKKPNGEAQASPAQ
jgi:hypothetical protein